MKSCSDTWVYLPYHQCQKLQADATSSSATEPTQQVRSTRSAWLEACLENVCRNQARYHVVQREVLMASSQVNGGSCDCNQDGGNVTGRQLCICDGVTGVIKQQPFWHGELQAGLA